LLPEVSAPEHPLVGWSVAEAIGEMRAAANDASWFCQLIDKAEKTRLCEWEGKTGTGRKSHLQGTTPWPEAADHEVHLVQELLDERNAARLAALSRGALTVTPTDGTDARKASLMKLVLRYYLGTAMKSQVMVHGVRGGSWADRWGHAVLYVGWKEERAVERRTVTLGQLVQVAIEKNVMGMGGSAPGTGPQEEADAAAPHQMEEGGVTPEEMQEIIITSEEMVLESVLDPARDGLVVELLLGSDEGLRARGTHGVEEAKRALGELRKSKAMLTAGDPMGLEVSYVSSFVKTSAPCWEALRPFIDVFYPAETVFEDNLDSCRWIARRKWLSGQQVREQAALHGWDKEVVQEILDKHRGKDSGLGDLLGTSWGLNGMGSRWRRRSGSATTTAGVGYGESHKNLYEVIEMWDRSTTPDGLTGTYHTVFHAQVADRPLKRKLLEYWSGCYPFVAMVAEKDEVMLLDSRGLPERVKTDQQAIKAQWDSRTDAAGLTTVPPWQGPPELMGTVIRPGAYIEEYRIGTVKAFELPAPDGRSVEIEKTIRRSLDNRFGRMSPEVPEPKSMMMGQADMDWFLMGISQAMALTAKLIQQYMPPLKQARITGTNEVFDATPEEVRGSYDFAVGFDVRSLDLDWAKELLSFVKDIILPMDRNAQVQTGPLIEFGLNILDPGLAMRSMRPVEAANAEEAAQERASLADIFSGGAGQEITEGMDYRTRAEVIVYEIQRSPMRQQVLATNAQVREVVTARLKQLVNMVKQYEENAVIGRTMGEVALQPKSEAEVLLEQLEAMGAEQVVGMN
jgi:hypothetical protein